MTPDTEERSPRLVLVAMTLANAMILVDQTAVPLALPDIMRSFTAGSREVQWVLTLSLLPLAALLVFGGRLGDAVGRRRVFIAGAVLFVGGSTLGGLAPELDVLMAARIVQGIGGALILPTSVAIVSSAFSAEQRGRALGTMGGAAAVFAALGPSIGGVLTSVLSWRAVLLINLPIAVATVLVARRYVPEDRAAGERERLSDMDVPGTVLLSVTMAGLVFGLSQSQASGWSSAIVLGPLAGALLAGIAFVPWERRADNPLVEFDLLRRATTSARRSASCSAGWPRSGSA